MNASGRLMRVAPLFLGCSVFLLAGCPGGDDDTDGGDNTQADSGPRPDATPVVPMCTPADCSDGIACTTDRCTQDGCVHVPDDSKCQTGELCRVTSGCFTPPRCTRADDPVCDDNQTCTSETCDVQSGRCVYTSNHAACDDGMFCTGAERCAPFEGCLLRTFPACDDEIGCTIDSCDEANDRCSNTPENRLCDDGMFCNGAETCNPAQNGCAAGTAPACGDGDACTDDTCDENANICVNSPRDTDMDGDPDIACGGGDCADNDPMKSSLHAEVCNGRDDDCDTIIDDGVLSACGNCDQRCRQTSTGTGTPGGNGFANVGMVGVTFSSTAGGLVIIPAGQRTNDLWVPNTAESTFSRWDATTAREIGRYRVGLPSGECPGACCWNGGCNMPSRVAVDSKGDAYVANRGFNIQGTITKVASNINDCFDKNGNGTIETSSTSTPLPYDTDECVLWNAPAGPTNAVLRALAVDLGDAHRPEGYVWAGGYNTRQFYKLDPRTGVTLATVDVPVAPYGAVVLSNGHMYIGTLSDGATAYIDTATTTPRASARIPYPAALRLNCGETYGITADERGRVWMSGWGCQDAIGYDPASGAWTRVDRPAFRNQVTGRGITVDSVGRIWMAVGGEGESSIAYWNADAFKPNANITAAVSLIRLPSGHSGPSGVGADINGNIWVGHVYTSQLTRLDPYTGAMTSFTGARQIYTYSDFTGSVRRTVIRRGSYQELHDAGCDNPTWDALSWDATIPVGGSINFRVRSSTSAATIGSAPEYVAAELPRDNPPVQLGQILTSTISPPGRFLQITTTLQSQGGSVTPVLKNYTLGWYCP